MMYAFSSYLKIPSRAFWTVKIDNPSGKQPILLIICQPYIYKHQSLNELYIHIRATSSPSFAKTSITHRPVNTIYAIYINKQ